MLSKPDDYKVEFGAVVVDLRHSHLPEWERFMADCALRGVPVYHTKQVKESLTGKVEIEHLSENTFGSLLPSLIYQRLKLLIDVIIAILVLPVVAVILVTSGRTVFSCRKEWVIAVNCSRSKNCEPCEMLRTLMAIMIKTPRLQN